jgi:hypothetical protein
LAARQLKTGHYFPASSKRGVHKLSNAPNLVHYAQRFRWRRAKGFMVAHEIVMSDMQRDRRDVVIQLL